MATPDQVGSPFRAAGALPVDRRYGGRIVAMDQLPIHALGDNYTVDGNGTVTSLPALPVGETVWLLFTGTPTLVNSAKLICPNSANYTAAVGDVAVARSDGDGTWRVFPIKSPVAALPTKYWSGLQHSNDVGTPNTKIDVAAGVCRDSTDTQNIVVASGVIDCTIVGANGLDAGTLAANTKYYTFAIAQANGAQALLASLSPTAPTLPGTYTKFRRIGFFKTASGAATILAFHQVNDHWYWDTSPRDVSTGATVGTTFASYVLSVPNVQGVTAIFSPTFFGSATITMFIMPGFLPSTAANGFAFNISTTGGGEIFTRMQVDSSGQIQAKASAASSTLVVDTAGWIDPL